MNIKHCKGNLSPVETVIELYDNIKINVVDDSVCKLIMELENMKKIG